MKMQLFWLAATTTTMITEDFVNFLHCKTCSHRQNTKEHLYYSAFKLVDAATSILFYHSIFYATVFKQKIPTHLSKENTK